MDIDNRDSWRRFRRNPLAMLSSVFISVSIIVAVVGYLITPDPTPLSNKQFLEISRKHPGFEVSMLRVTKNHEVARHSWLVRMLMGEDEPFDEIPVDSIRVEGNIVKIYPYTNSSSPIEDEVDIANVLFSVNPDSSSQISGGNLRYFGSDSQHHQTSLSSAQSNLFDRQLVKHRFILGTDRYGRDMTSQLIIGMRVSLSVGFMAVIISLIIGIVLGAFAGYFGGWIDHAIMWFINVVWSMPSLLLVIAITFALGKGFWQVFLAIGFTMWVEVARVVRGQIMSLREKEFVEASVALGYSNSRVLFRHILPNVLSPVIVVSAANFATAILIEAGLSFLGIGVQPPMPSWGTMIRDHAAYIILDSAFLAFLPGMAIMIMVLAFMVAGNGLRDALDVKT